MWSIVSACSDRTAGDAYVQAVQSDTGKGFIHLDLFGFSDGAIYPMLVSHWGLTHPDKSEFTGFSHVPYVEAEDKGIAQDGEVLRNELVAILRATKPTLIVFPDAMENDSDHAG